VPDLIWFFRTREFWLLPLGGSLCPQCSIWSGGHSASVPDLVFSEQESSGFFRSVIVCVLCVLCVESGAGRTARRAGTRFMWPGRPRRVRDLRSACAWDRRGSQKKKQWHGHRRVKSRGTRITLP